MGGPTLTQPLTESCYDLALVPRIQPNRPAENHYVFPDYGNWAVNVGTGAVAVDADAGYFGEDVLEITTTGDGNNNEVRSPLLSPTIAGLDSDASVCLMIKADHVARVGTVTILTFQGGFVNGMEFSPVTTDVFRNDGEWAFVECVRQNHPQIANVAAPNWVNACDYMEINVQDNGGGVDGVVTVSVGAIFRIETSNDMRNGPAFFFDQAWVSAYEQIQYAMLHGIGCCVAVIPELLGQPGYMDLSQIRGLYNGGCEVCTTTQHDLRYLSRQDRCNELARLKRWCYKHNFVRGADMFVYPDGAYDLWTAFDVKRFFSVGRTLNDFPAISTPFMAESVPCLKVTTHLNAALDLYADYGQADYGNAQFFAFRGFSVAGGAVDYYSIGDYEDLVDDHDDDRSTPPFAMLTNGG